MNVERKRETMPVLVAAVDNDRMALLALKGILPQLLPYSQWLWGTGDADEAVAKALSPETRPRLLLVDMSLGEATGVSVCRKNPYPHRPGAAARHHRLLGGDVR